MARGERQEIAAFKAAKVYYNDNNMEHFGGMNNTAPDLLRSNGEIIEVKADKAQCGQFTDNTAENYKFSTEVMDLFPKNKKNNMKVSGPICTEWVKNYYLQNKKVSAFAIVDENYQTIFYTPEEFFANFVFTCTYRCKASGTTTNTPKWCWKYIPAEWNCEYDGKYMVAKNKSAINQTIKVINTQGQEKRMWVNDEGRVKIKSETASPTYIFSLKRK